MRYLTTTLLALSLLLTACAGGSGGSNGGGAMLTITTNSLPTATISQAYTATLQAANGTPPYTWSLESGTLPAGLNFDAPTATISGTPTALGTSTLTFKVTDTNFGAALKTLDLTVDPLPPLTITTTSLPGGATGTLYTSTLSATGGVAPYTWSVASGTLPVGLSLNPGTGEISGTPTVAASYPFDIQVSDSLSAVDQSSFSIITSGPVSIATQTALPAAYEGVAYYARLDATGGRAPYQWSLVSGTLPPGLTLDTVGLGVCEITGTPTTSAVSNFVLAVADANALADSRSAMIEVRRAIVFGAAQIEITSLELPHATYGEYYEYSISAGGGWAPYYWTLSGQVPEGLYVDAYATTGGVLRGRPREAGAFALTALAEDGTHTPRSVTFNLVVDVAVEALPDGAVGTDYNFTAQVLTPGAQLVGIASSPDIPGASVNVNGGLEVNGTPSSAAQYAFNLELKVGTWTTNQLIGLPVSAAPGALQITTSTLPGSIRGSAYNYSATLQAQGGSGTGYTWALATGSSLPPGISGLPASGTPAATISGTPTASGTFNFTVEVTDSSSNTATANLSIEIIEPISGDFNGDGHADAMVGSNGAAQGLRIFYAEPAALRFGSIGVRDADFIITGRANECTFGDFNGDGVSDVAVVSTAAGANRGTVSVVFGSASTPRFGQVAAASADVHYMSGTSGDAFGTCVTAGDLDGDSFDDLVIGAITATTTVTQGGKLHIFYGGASLSSTPDASLNGLNRFGDSAAIKDITNDGAGELLVSGSNNALLFYGASTRFSGTVDAKATADAEFKNLDVNTLRTRLAFGDFNGDNIGDVLAGCRYDSFLFYGGTGALPFSGAISSPGATFTHPTIGGSTTYVAVSAADFNNDGIDDIGFATPEQGMAYVHFGSATNPHNGAVDSASADLFLNFGASDYASWLISGCDFNGDGLTDIMVSARAFDAPSPTGVQYDAGALLIIYGTSTPLTGQQGAPANAGVLLVGQSTSAAYGVCGSGG